MTMTMTEWKPTAKMAQVYVMTGTDTHQQMALSGWQRGAFQKRKRRRTLVVKVPLRSPSWHWQQSGPNHKRHHESTG
jgi:hypothetical protein